MADTKNQRKMLAEFEFVADIANRLSGKKRARIVLEKGRQKIRAVDKRKRKQFRAIKGKADGL